MKRLFFKFAYDVVDSGPFSVSSLDETITFCCVCWFVRPSCERPSFNRSMEGKEAVAKLKERPGNKIDMTLFLKKSPINRLQNDRITVGVRREQ